MEVSALKYPTGVARHARSPLIRLQSDEHLIKLIRCGHDAAFESLVSRYESRLLAFCRHLLGSREDAEDVLQEVFSAAYNAIHGDDRPINVRPWLYRIARNRSLNHMRRTQAIGLDSMDVLFAANGESTADKVHQREEFRQLVGDIHGLPESQRTALILRELDALPYDQIAEAMETSVSSVKSLLVRARVGLTEAAEARLLSCGEVRTELAEIAEGLTRRQNPLVRRHLKSCDRCATFNKQLKRTNRALAGLMPVGPLVVWKTGLLSHLPGHAGGGAAAAGSSAAGSGYLGAGIGAMATKAAAGLAVAAVVAAASMSGGGSGHLSEAMHPRLGGTVSGSHQASTSTATAKHRTHLSAAHSGTKAQSHPVIATALHQRQLPATSHQTRQPISAGLTSTGSGAINNATPTPSTSSGSSATSSADSDSGSGSGSAGSGRTAVVGTAGGTAAVGAGAVSSTAGAVSTVAGSLGASLGGSGGAGSSSGSQTTLTIPVLTPPAAGSGSSQPAPGTITTPALATPAS